MTIAWVLEVDPRYGMRHGALLRYVNLSRGLVALGHTVYYLLMDSGGGGDLRPDFLATLKREKVLSDVFYLPAPAPRGPEGLLRHFRIHPFWRDRHLAASRESYARAFEALISRLTPDVCIVSHRPMYFLLRRFANLVPMVADWCDSFTLIQTREIQLAIKDHQVQRLPSMLKRLVEVSAEERYYGRQSRANIFVSPVDKLCMDRLSGLPEHNHVLRNGVTRPAPMRHPVTKEKNRIIFTGSMSFPPNARGALWFIDKVMPELIRRRPEIRLVIAGQEPSAELLAKDSEYVEIAGMVPDMHAEIARSQLYVAPLFSGAGFRNKVVEAISSGTYIIGTPMSLEFLDERVQAGLGIASTAEEFVDRIVEYLEDPVPFEPKLRRAMEIIEAEYSWEQRVRELERLCLASIPSKTSQSRQLQAASRE